MELWEYAASNPPAFHSNPPAFQLKYFCWPGQLGTLREGFVNVGGIVVAVLRETTLPFSERTSTVDILVKAYRDSLFEWVFRAEEATGYSITVKKGY